MSIQAQAACSGWESFHCRSAMPPLTCAAVLLLPWPLRPPPGSLQAHRIWEILAEAQDPTATELFRHGLQSTNAPVLAYSIPGLGRLRDSTAIPLIQKACDHIQAGDKLALAMQLPWFGIDAE